MKKLIAAIILVLVLCGTACARFPQIGDKVTITTASKQDTGTITDIKDGFICYQITQNGKTYDECVGIGAITFLYWPDEQR